MKTGFRILSLICIILFSFAACTETAQPAEPTPVAEAPTPESNDPDTVLIVTTEPPTSEPTPEPTPEPTATPTPEPTATPAPTRAPKAGDIAVNFPDFDTGADADYSYQSDELRIAIKVVVDSEAKQTYYIADIWMRNISSFRTGFGKGQFKKGVEDGDKLARRENAILAVNGSYNQGLVIRSGELLQRLRANKGWNSDSACIIYKNGTMKTFRLKKEPLNPKEEIKNGAWFGWQFGPILIRDYEPFAGATAHGELGYKARNMLGYYEPGHYVIVNCDAYRDDAKGMTAQMMVDLMKSLGVKDAFNLDGGTSAVMVFMGEVINRPTPRIENGKKVPGRPLLDMLLFAEYDENGVAPDLSTLQADKFMNKN